jgi:peroxiredoxin
MTELGELEAAHVEFEKKNAQVVIASLENQETAKATQADFPHLVILADPDRRVANAFDVIHPASAPDGGDTSAPTTFVIDGQGAVRWTYRPPSVFRRLSPREVLAALDEHGGAE